MGAAVSERRIRNNRIRRRRELRRNILTAIFTVTLVIACSGLFFGLKTKAQGNDEEFLYKYYKTVNIAKDDTLWDYACQYADNQFYDDYQSYIDEVMRINSLKGDSLTCGQHIILPYYSPEFIQ